MAKIALSSHFCLATAMFLLHCVSMCDSTKPLEQSEPTETPPEAEHHTLTENRTVESLPEMPSEPMHCLAAPLSLRQNLLVAAKAMHFLQVTGT